MSHNIVALQHLLPSFDWLRRSIPENLNGDLRFLMGKHYSTIPPLGSTVPDRAIIVPSVDDIPWQQLGPTLLILDEGGAMHRALPQQLCGGAAGVEQTSSGLQVRWRYPVSLVCRSGAKLFFESQIIARGILRKLENLGLLDGRQIGVVGVGALGAELARRIRARGIPIAVYDIARPKGDLSEIGAPLMEVLADSDLILGCTGVDALAGVEFSQLTGKKLFASCSSRNVEFRSLLGLLSLDETYGVAHGHIAGCDIGVLNGGYPINFDRKREWELFGEILLTRKICLQGLVEAQQFLGSPPRGVMLSPAAQFRIVSEWLEQVPDPHDLHIPPVLTEHFFLNLSEGDHSVTGKPDYYLHSTTPDALALMRSHRAPYEKEIAGLPIIILPGVWSPAYDWSSQFYIENFPEVRNQDFLEIGSGTGVISVFAARKGARRVVAVDVNAEAVRNTALNFERFGVTNGKAMYSDLFGSVREKFDYIIWNAPYHGARPADVLERGCTDEDYTDIRTFFRQVGAFLNPGGRIGFGFSESGDLPLIERLIDEAGFRVRRRLSDWRQNYNCMVFELSAAGTDVSHSGE